MTFIDEALSGVSTLAFDSDCIIYFMNQDTDHDAPMIEIFLRVASSRICGLTSTITLTEGLVYAFRNGDLQIQQEYRDLLNNSNNFRLVAIDSSIAERAAELRARYNLRTPDALQVATAIDTGCEAFLTNNARHFKRVTDLRVLILDELEL